MNIKKIIDTERWGKDDYGHEVGCWQDLHNFSLDRIQAAVDKRIAELESLLCLAIEPITYAYAQGLVGAEEIGRKIEEILMITTKELK